jgi:hypothetical protein
MRGIVICAYGHPYYGVYAANLAASIKFSCPELSITLLHDEAGVRHFTPNHFQLFDRLHTIPQDCFYSNGVLQFYRAKLFSYFLSSYEETIFLDADMIMLPKGRNLNTIFDELKDIDFTIQNRNNFEINQETSPDMWANLADIKTAYQISEGKFYYISSEFIYFKKSENNEKIFKDAITIYDSLKISYKRFGGGIPDELPLSISMLCNGVNPHENGYSPIYWESAEKKGYRLEQLYQTKYIGYSAGGHIAANNRMKEVYNTLVQFYAAKYGLPPFLFRDKRSFIKERANL